jgi:hypothetical protein
VPTILDTKAWTLTVNIVTPRAHAPNEPDADLDDKDLEGEFGDFDDEDDFEDDDVDEDDWEDQFEDEDEDDDLQNE